jgi:hypothetical protein
MIKLFEKYRDLDDVKGIIFHYAVKTLDLDTVEFFVNKGYDINSDTEKIFYEGSYDKYLLKYLLDKGLKIEDMQIEYNVKERLKNIVVQKVLIDCGYELFIYQTVGFNHSIKNDPKYADIVDRFEQAKQYNL